MQAIVLKEPYDIRHTTRDMPSAGKDEALIRIRRIGICGTDYHAFHGRQPYFDYPRILGHELAGEIAELPPGEGRFQAGDRVTIVPYLNCGDCYACRRGVPNACINLRVMGVHIDGGMQEYVTVPVRQLVRAEDLSWDQLAIVEPLAISAHAVNRANLKPGDRVLVVGAGPIGLAAMKMAKLAGAYVIAMDVNERRLAFAEKWAGCDKLIQASSEAERELASVTNGEMPQVIFDATGNVKAMEQSFQYASHGGKIVFISLVQGDIRFSDPLFHKKELTLFASRSSTMEAFKQVVAAIRSGKVDADAFITHRAPFKDGAEAFLSWIKPESAVIKAVLEL